MLARLAAVLLGVAVLTLAGRRLQRRQGRVTTEATTGAPRAAAPAAAQLPGLAGATRAGVLFGSPTCAPCDTVKALLRELAADAPGFRWTYVDAADHLDLADAYAVRRVPTLVVLDADGAVVARTSGVPAREELRRVLLDPVAA